MIVVLDIDQTLVYSSNSPSQNDEASFHVFDSIRKERLFVYKRPYLDLFLDELNHLQDNGIIELATYTAGTQQYADDILRHIDPQYRIKLRFYRNDCIMDNINKVLLKDLTFVYQKIKEQRKAANANALGLQVDSTSSDGDLSQDLQWMNASHLKRMIIVDDSISTYRNFQNNTINIKPWKNDSPRDHVLKDCLAILKQMQHSNDVSQDLPQFVELYNSLVYS